MDDLTPELSIAMAPSPKVANHLRNQFIRNGVKFDEDEIARLQKTARNDAAKPRNLSLAENAQLQQLKRQMVESSLDRQHVQKQGGPRAVAAKQRAESLFSENQHRKGR
ncbi:MAG: hypothetical protein KA535_11220 [Azonexus sp.]|nr:hypothetical protein [Azonexus sp.]